MSAAEGRNGSAPGTDDQDLAALRASARCGRSLPVLHLVDSDEVFAQRRGQRSPIVLCCAEVAAPDPEAEDRECLGCLDCVRYCPECVSAAARLSAGEPGEDPEHPAWCSPGRCYRTDEGERVHQGVPVRWEDCGVRFEITLVRPEDDYRTYVELQLASLALKDVVYAAMPVPSARRLRDQLSAQLNAAALNWVGGLAGRVMTGSDPGVPAPGGGSDCAP